MTNTKAGISLNDIAGICPQVSTYADVLQLLGDDFDIEYQPAEQLERNLLLAKVILHYREIGIVIVFLDTGGLLPPEAKVTVVGVEALPLKTKDGLYVGMPMDEAVAIISSNYHVYKKESWFIDFTSKDGDRTNLMTVFESDGKVRYIKLFVEV